jgi:glycerol-3-phosphate cytidylyltransferase
MRKSFAPSQLPTFAASSFPAPPRRSLALPAGTTVAITYGTFDLFHVGHVRLFERIKRRFGYLVVAVSTDEFNAVKGKKSTVHFDDRIELVRACRHVDLAIPETGWAQKENDIVHYGADAFVMGSDWDGKFDHLKSLTEVIYLARTEGVSSSELKQAVRRGTQ